MDLHSILAAEQEMLINDRPFSWHNENTITTMRRENLDRIAGNGYALDDVEDELGIRCIGVPIFGADRQPVASLCVAAPVHRIAPDSIQALAGNRSLATISQKSSRKILLKAGGHKSVAG